MPVTVSAHTATTRPLQKQAVGTDKTHDTGPSFKYSWNCYGIRRLM